MLSKRRSTLAVVITTAVMLLLLPHQQSPVMMIHAQQCSVCEDGSTPSGSFGSTDCSVIEESISMTPEDDPTCAMVRLEGFMNCNCPTLPQDSFCSLCDFGGGTYEEPLYSSTSIPTLGGLTCKEVEFLDAVDARCSNLSEAAWFCGCPGGDSLERGICYLCSNQQAAPNNLKLPPSFEKTCAEVDREGGLYYSDAETTCEMLLLGEDVPVDFDYESYCGCSGDNSAAPPDTCTLCGGGGTVQNPDGILPGTTSMTCTELETVSRFVVSDQYCQEMAIDFANFCCNPPMPTTDAPIASAPAPTQAPMTMEEETPSPFFEAPPTTMTTPPSSAMSPWSMNFSLVIAGTGTILLLLVDL